jgi:hypothetical protein
MDPKRFSGVINSDVMRTFMLFRHGKALKKVPHKTIEYYTEDTSVQSKPIYLPSHRKQGKNTIDQLK